MEIHFKDGLRDLDRWMMKIVTLCWWWIPSWVASVWITVVVVSWRIGSKSWPKSWTNCRRRGFHVLGVSFFSLHGQLCGSLMVFFLHISEICSWSIYWSVEMIDSCFWVQNMLRIDQMMFLGSWPPKCHRTGEWRIQRGRAADESSDGRSGRWLRLYAQLPQACGRPGASPSPNLYQMEMRKSSRGSRF